MPELPEIIILSKQMNQEIRQKKIAEIEVLQPKNLNIPVEEFVDQVVSHRILGVNPKGKWLIIELSEEQFLLINLGMGGDLLYFTAGTSLPETYKFKMRFTDDSGFTINFSWFGYIHVVDEKGLTTHQMTANLGISPLDKEFSLEYFRDMVSNRRGKLKSFLMNQHRIAGIGNVYIQDILYGAELHPNRPINTLSNQEIGALYSSMRDVLIRSVERGGLAYERDFYGNKGGFTSEQFLVAYKTGEPCPRCSSPIEKIRTGSTASYICPKCQKG